MENFEIINNAEFNSTEIYFDGKPCEATREALKALRFRWHAVKKCWYGYADAETVRAALNGEPVTTSEKQPEKAARLSLWERTRTDGLHPYGGGNPLYSKFTEEARAAGDYNEEKRIAAYCRKHLRERFPECKFSITSSHGYCGAVDIELQASPYGRELVKDARGWDKWENSPELSAVINYAQKLHESFDADDGDHWADYGAHHNIYGHATIASGYTQTEPTADDLAEIAEFEKAKAAADAVKAEAARVEWERMEQERERERIESEKREAKRREEAERIRSAVTVEDLADGEQIAVCDLVELFSKCDTLQHAEDTAKEYDERRNDAIISRKLHFESADALELFKNQLLTDFDFLAGKGGSASEDPDAERMNDLNKEQRARVRWFLADCVGVYLGGVLQFVIDPEGYPYARYTLMPDEKTTEKGADEFRAELRGEAQQRAPFYVPAPISEQIKSADVKRGEAVTAFSVDPLLCVCAEYRGTAQSLAPTTYAQNSDAGRRWLCSSWPEITRS